MLTYASYFGAIKPISPVAATALDALARPLHLPRGHTLQRAGHVSRDIYLLRKGLARAFFYHDGREVTNEFFAEGEIAGDMQSVYAGRPGHYQLELLEDCELLQLNYAGLEGLYANHHDLESCGRLLAIDCFFGENARNRGFQMMTATERYRQFCTERHQLLQRVNLGHVASYIGITQVQLSRIRKELSTASLT